MTEPLRQLLETDGLAVEASGNRPFLLDGADSVWLVTAGAVDVFAVLVCQGEPAGGRQHLFRLEAGRFLFAGPPLASDDASGLLVVGLPGTQLRKLALPRVRELTQSSPASSSAVAEAGSEGSVHAGCAAAVDGWIEVLSRGIVLDPPPKVLQQISPGANTSLTPATAYRSAGGVVWVQSGGVQFLGNPSWSIEQEQVPLPLAPGAWLTCARDVVVTGVNSDELLQTPAFWAGLEGWHRLVCRVLREHQQRRENAARQRLTDRSAEDEALMAGAVARLASVLEPRTAPLADGRPTQPLLAACQVVGQNLGVKIQAPAGSQWEQARDPLEIIARTSRIRTRRVLLRDRWWQEDHGPLLGQVEENGVKRPAALVPAPPRGYDLVDPVQGTRTPVTAELAAHIVSQAWTFYRHLPERPLSGRDLVRFVLPELKTDPWMVLGMGILGGLVGLVMPLATGIIVDELIPGAERWQLLQMCLGLAAAALATTVFQITRQIALLRIEGKAGTALQAGIWDRLLNLPARFFSDQSAGDLTLRAMGVDTIRRLLTGTVVTTCLSAIFSVFNLALLFYYSFRLGLWACAASLAGLLITLTAVVFQIRYQRELTTLQGKISGMVLQFLAGIAKLCASGTEGRAFARWAEQFSRQTAWSLKSQMVGNVLAVFDAMFPVLTAMLVYAVVVFGGESGFTTGSFLAFSSALTSFLTAVTALGPALLSLTQILPLYERMKPILEARPEIDEARVDPSTLTGDIEVSHVVFRYRPEDPPVLNDVSLRFRPGEFVAIVGPSGSGKSTLFRLLVGFDRPESGAVFYDGKDLAGLDLRALRRQIGVVLQNGRLMPGELFTNIIGAFNLTIDDAWTAARMAGLEDDVKAMPMGMHTFIGEGLSTLSGGQRQRLLIARAVVNRPRILFFDEATSALDNRTQAIVTESLCQLQATRVVIAHRLSTVMRADRIYVLHKGQIVQTGTYQGLLDQPGLFQDLAKRQLV